MRFELSVALRYLIPKKRQLSMSVISLVSILVIAAVVWLGMVFFSVQEGIQKRWIDGFISVNAPIRVAPTKAYFDSYYYQIDRFALNSAYTTKTIGEKLAATLVDPYDAQLDRALPEDFPKPLKKDGTAVDLVKEGWRVMDGITGAHPEEFESSFANFTVDTGGLDENRQLSQLSYIMTINEANPRLASTVMKPSVEDLNALLLGLSGEDLASFFNGVSVQRLVVKDAYWELPKALYPEKGVLHAIELESGEIVIPKNPEGETFELTFEHGELTSLPRPLFLEQGAEFEADIASSTKGHPFFHVKTELQGVELSGNVSMRGLQIAQAAVEQKRSPLWFSVDQGPVEMPYSDEMGEGVLVSKNYKKRGVSLGARGIFRYADRTSSAMAEQKIPVYIAGFFDPGLSPFSDKFVFVGPDLAAALRGNPFSPTEFPSNGINVWVDKMSDVISVKNEIEEGFVKAGLSPFFEVRSIYDFEYSRPILLEFESEKTVFSLIALIILLVACSNIISMLIILVNDKKREIGVLQALGATPRSITYLFGFCGLMTGVIASLVGTALALTTLYFLNPLMQFVSRIKGQELFLSQFFGESLPTQISWSALGTIVGTTVVISLLAGLIPAMKAARVRPSEILRKEG